MVERGTRRGGREMTIVARVGGRQTKHNEAKGRVPELWLCDKGVTGLVVKIRNWETGMNWRGTLHLS